MKRTIKLTESDIHNIVRESVNEVLNESGIVIQKTYTTKKGNKHHTHIELWPQNGDSNILSGDFEYWVEEHDEDTYASGNIYIENGEVVDFDGCFDLPKAIKKALNDNGYATDW